MSSRSSTPTEIYEYLFKVIVVGDSGTGKTSIIRRYVTNSYVASYKATIGLDFCVKKIKWNDNAEVSLQLWDVAGQERFSRLTRAYYKGANAAVVVFDVTQEDSFRNTLRWKEDIDEKMTMNGESIPTILFANKVDMPVGQFMKDRSVVEQFCNEHNFAGWFETSAKDNLGIDAGMKFLVDRLTKTYTIEEETDTDIVRISNRQPQPQQDNCPC